jgi:hypothetical protein
LCKGEMPELRLAIIQNTRLTKFLDVVLS